MEIKTTQEISDSLMATCITDSCDQTKEEIEYSHILAEKKWVSIDEVQSVIVDALKDTSYISKNELAGVVFKKLK